jgi:hypothetical protein
MPITRPSWSSAGPRHERTTEEDLRVEAALDQAVVRALGDREAHVERVAERVDALALREALRFGAKRERVERAAGRRVFGRRGCRRIGCLEQRQVVQHVELQDLQRRFAAVGRDVDEVVALGLQGRFGNDVEVGDDVALARDEEARADRGLARPALQHRADLQQLRARLLVDLACRQRQRCRRCGLGRHRARRRRGLRVRSAGAAQRQCQREHGRRGMPQG